MESFYKEFTTLLDKEDKQNCVSLVLTYLEKAQSEKDIVKLYTDVLEKSLDEMTCNLKNKKMCIWKEHVRSSIIRTILENCYPYIIKFKQKSNNTSVKKTVSVLCPDGEYHEIGARMISDFFTLSGYESTYVGSSLPKEDFIEAINEIKPNIVAISITNYYNLVAAKKTIHSLKLKVNYPLIIVVGGTAFENNPTAYKEIGADKLLSNFEDIKKLKEEEPDASCL